MSRSRNKWYFAFGSNMDPAQMEERGISTKVVKKAFLKNYRLTFNFPSPRYGGGGVADVVWAIGSVVRGVLYKVAEEDLKKLDHFEGVAQGAYRRREVPVKVDDGHRRRATFYEVVNKSNTFIKPSKRYMERLIRGAEAHNLRSSYIQKLQSIPSSEA